MTPLSDGLPEIDLKNRLESIKNNGFVRTLRPGDTGIGYTLETLLHLPETNKPGVGDFTLNGTPVELKSQRKETCSMITLFTKEPSKDAYDDRAMISAYGYSDAKGRPALKVTLNAISFTPQGIRLRIDRKIGRISIMDKNGKMTWSWDIENLKPKIGTLAIVLADTVGSGANESFHFNEAYFLSGLKQNKLYDLFDSGEFLVDLRMHLKNDGGVRNRGTAFRIRSLEKLVPCYEHHERLI